MKTFFTPGLLIKCLLLAIFIAFVLSPILYFIGLYR